MISPHPAAQGTSQSLGELAGPAAPTLQARPYTQLQAHPFLASTLPPQCVLSSLHGAGLGSPHFGQDWSTSLLSGMSQDELLSPWHCFPAVP